jgi:hypothetical protein
MRFRQYLESHPFYGKPDSDASIIRDISREGMKAGSIGRIHAITPHRPCGVMNLTPPKRFKRYSSKA